MTSHAVCANKYLTVQVVRLMEPSIATRRVLITFLSSLKSRAQRLFSAFSLLIAVCHVPHEGSRIQIEHFLSFIKPIGICFFSIFPLFASVYSRFITVRCSLYINTTYRPGYPILTPSYCSALYRTVYLVHPHIPSDL